MKRDWKFCRASFWESCPTSEKWWHTQENVTCKFCLEQRTSIFGQRWWGIWHWLGNIQHVLTPTASGPRRPVMSPTASVTWRPGMSNASNTDTLVTMLLRLKSQKNFTYECGNVHLQPVWEPYRSCPMQRLPPMPVPLCWMQHKQAQQQGTRSPQPGWHDWWFLPVWVQDLLGEIRF